MTNEYLAIHYILFIFKYFGILHNKDLRLDMANTSGPSTWEAEAGGSLGVQGQHELFLRKTKKTK